MGELVHLHPPTPERWLTRKEIAEHLGVCVSTVDRWVRDGMPSEKFGPQIRRFRVRDAEQWLERRSA